MARLSAQLIEFENSHHSPTYSDLLHNSGSSDESNSIDFNQQPLQENINLAGPLEVVNELKTLVSKMTTDVLQISLPDQTKLNSLRCPCFSAGVFATDVMDTVVFGLKRRGDVLPLHDHKRIYGFVHALRGKLKITSYSWLEPEQEMWYFHEMEKANGHHYHHPTAGKIPAKFEGETILSADECQTPEQAIAVLGPITGNIHQVEALTDGVAFFDLLIPGYQQQGVACTYYSVESIKEGAAPSVGSIVWLRPIPEPSTFTMQHIDYDPPVNGAELLKLIAL